MINWKQKLSSRKLWTLIITLVTNILVLFAVPAEMIVQVCAVISSAGVAVAYIMGEATVDAAAAGSARKEQE